jgi:hypothetical protein
MNCDMHIDYDRHLMHKNVWRVYVEMPMQSSPKDALEFLSISVDVIASDRDLAQYIVARMYPDYESISVDDSPLSS